MNTLVVMAACGLFSLAFAVITAFSLRQDFSTPIEKAAEAIFVYPPWSDKAQNLAQVRDAGATLVSSNSNDTAWLVNVPSAEIGQAILAGNAWSAFKPSELAIVVAGCGAVVVDQSRSSTHSSADNLGN